MKKLLTIIMICAALAVAFQCHPSSEREVDFSAWQRDLEDEKQEVMQALTELNDSIDVQLEHLTLKSAQAGKDIQGLTSNVEGRLLNVKKKVKSAMKEVRSSTDSTWD